MVRAWQGRDIPRLNNAAEPPRHRRDKGGETAERSSAMALYDMDSLSLSAGPGSLTQIEQCGGTTKASSG